jgi:hypothetical protein
MTNRAGRLKSRLLAIFIGIGISITGMLGWSQTDPTGVKEVAPRSLTSTGNVVRELPLPTGESVVNGIGFQEASGTASAALWVAGFYTLKIYKLDFTTGAVLSSFNLSTSPGDLAWDGSNIYETDFETSRVTKFSPAGAVLGSFACPGSAGGCEGITSDGTNLYIGNGVDSTIYKVNSAGSVLNSFASPGTSGGADGLGFNHNANALIVLGYDGIVYELNPSSGAVIGTPIPLASGEYNGGAFDGVNFWVANSTAGKIQAIDVGAATAPILQITMNKSTYIDGDTITASEFRLQNLGTTPTVCELKVWLGVPGIAPISVLNLGADGSFTIPAGFNQNFGPLNLLTVSSGLPRGAYEFSSRVLNPVMGNILSEDLNPFVIQ